MSQGSSSHGPSPLTTQVPPSEVVIQSTMRASEAGHMPEQPLQPADTLPALQPEGVEHQTSQMDPPHLSLQAEDSADSTCEGLLATDITADGVKHSSDAYLPHTALLDASAPMEQDRPLILQQPASDWPPESAGQLIAQHTDLSLDTAISSARAEGEGQQEHSIGGNIPTAPALQDADRHGRPSFASLDEHAATAPPSTDAPGFGDEGALTGHSSSRVAAHDLAFIPTDAAGLPVHHSEDLEGTEPKQNSALPAQKPSPIVEEGGMPQAQTSSAQTASACCGAHVTSGQVSTAKQVVSAPAGTSAAAAGSITHSLRLQDTYKAQVSSEQDDSAERESECQPDEASATAEVNEVNSSEHSQTAERPDVSGSAVDGGGASMTGRGTDAAEAAASDAESQSATQEELLALASAVAQLEAQLAQAQESASRLEQEAHAVREEAAQWRDREADASAQVQLPHALMTVFPFAVQPSL